MCSASQFGVVQVNLLWCESVWCSRFGGSAVKEQGWLSNIEESAVGMSGSHRWVPRSYLAQEHEFCGDGMLLPGNVWEVRREQMLTLHSPLEVQSAVSQLCFSLGTIQTSASRPLQAQLLQGQLRTHSPPIQSAAPVARQMTSWQQTEV